MITGMKETQLLYADNLDLQKKVLLSNKISHALLQQSHVSLAVTIHTGAKAVTEYRGQFGADDAITLPYFLDDVGCSGSESNLLECLPQHNCGTFVIGRENAGVQCSRKGINNDCIGIFI